MLDTITHSIFAQQGSIPGQYRASDESRWYVYDEAWSRLRLLDTTVLFSTDNEQEAKEYAANHQKT